MGHYDGTANEVPFDEAMQAAEDAYQRDQFWLDAYQRVELTELDRETADQDAVGDEG